MMFTYLLYMLIGFLILISTLVMTIWFKTNRILNFYIILTTLILCFYLITYGFNNCELNLRWKISSMNYYQVFLSLTPATYLFFEKLILNYKYPNKKDLVYFILPIILYGYMENRNFQDSFFEMGIVFLFFVGYAIFYFWKTYKLLKPILWNDLYEVDTLCSVVKNWASFIFRMAILVKIHFIVFFLFKFLQIRINIDLVRDSTLLVVFLIGYFKVSSSPSLFYGTSKLQEISNVVIADSFVNKVWVFEPNKRIDNPREKKIHERIRDKIPELIQQIEYIAYKNNSFRQHDYSINKLSLEIGVPKYYLEYIYKYYCKISFNDYKKIVRISDSINLINEGYLTSNTLDSLAFYVGFASYNPFLTNFKDIVGMPPFDYYKNKAIKLNSNEHELIDMQIKNTF